MYSCNTTSSVVLGLFVVYNFVRVRDTVKDLINTVCASHTSSQCISLAVLSTLIYWIIKQLEIIEDLESLWS